MVYEDKCKLNAQRHPTIEFYIDDEPQVYCRGYIDMQTDEPFKECQNCRNFADGRQAENDFQKTKN